MYPYKLLIFEQAPYWRRGNESCEMIKPWYHKMSILAFGSSVGTTSGAIEADVLVVNSYEELDQRRAEVKYFHIL